MSKLIRRNRCKTSNPPLRAFITQSFSAQTIGNPHPYLGRGDEVNIISLIKPTAVKAQLCRTGDIFGISLRYLEPSKALEGWIKGKKLKLIPNSEITLYTFGESILASVNTDKLKNAKIINFGSMFFSTEDNRKWLETFHIRMPGDSSLAIVLSLNMDLCKLFNIPDERLEWEKVAEY